MVASSFLASLASLWQLLHFFTFTNFVCSTSFRLTNLSFDNTNAQPQCQTETISPIHASPLQVMHSKRLHLLPPIMYLPPLTMCVGPHARPPTTPRGIGMAIGGMHYWGSAASGLHGAAAAHLTLPRAPLPPNPCTPIPLHTSSLKSTFLSKIPPNLVKLLQSIMTLLMVIGMCNTNYPCQI